MPQPADKLAALKLRVRSHGGMARMEAGAGGFGILAAHRSETAAAARRAGFACAALDLEDFSTGRLDEML